MFRALLAVLFLSTAAHAAPEGVVMRVDDAELFINLGTADGLKPGSTLQVFRRVVLEHPISHKTMEDRFPIGVVKVTEAGKLLSIVRVFKGLKRSPAPGDFVVFGFESKTPALRTPVITVAAKDPEEAALTAILHDNLGRSPADRVANLRGFRAVFPKGKFGVRVDKAIAVLTAQTEVEIAKAAVPIDPTIVPLSTRHLPVKNVEMGRALALAIAIAEVDRVDTVQLVMRRQGPGPWTTIPMSRSGDFYWRAPVPPSLLAEPGTLEYAIEATRSHGVTESLVADLLKAKRITVDPRPVGEDPPGASHVEFMVRSVDFNISGDAKDHYTQTEMNFRYDVNFDRLHSVEVGVGLIDGEGGEVSEIDKGNGTEQLTMGYAFAAAELRLTENLGLGGRITRGSRRANEGAGQSVAGVQLHTRLGRADDTHLSVGFAALDDLGSRYFAELNIRAWEKMPITASAEATNLPVDEDFGLRLTGNVGWRVVDWLTLKVEGGWNARTINHYGFTLGSGLALDWD